MVKEKEKWMKLFGKDVLKLTLKSINLRIGYQN